MQDSSLTALVFPQEARSPFSPFLTRLLPD